MDKKIQIEREVSLAKSYFELKRYDLKHTQYAGGWCPLLSRDLLVRKNAVGVVAYDPEADVVVLIEQFRIGAMAEHGGAWLTEIVAGEIEAGETAIEVAYRETEEEAGCSVQALIPIQDMYLSPGGSTERIELFCARVDASDVHETVRGVSHEGEDILVRAVPYSEVVSALSRGDIRSAIPLAALQWLVLNRSTVRSAWGFMDDPLADESL